MSEGTLPDDDLRRAFVAGAKWWEWHQTLSTMWQSDRNIAEAEAEKRYPDGKPYKTIVRDPVGECDLCHRKTWDGIDGETCGSPLTQDGELCLGILRYYAAEQPQGADADNAVPVADTH